MQFHRDKAGRWIPVQNLDVANENRGQELHPYSADGKLVRRNCELFCNRTLAHKGQVIVSGTKVDHVCGRRK